MVPFSSLPISSLMKRVLLLIRNHKLAHILVHLRWLYASQEVEQSTDLSPLYSRNLPRALIITGLVMTVLYVITNVSYHILLSPEDLVARESIAIVSPVTALSHVFSLAIEALKEIL